VGWLPLPHRVRIWRSSAAARLPSVAFAVNGVKEILKDGETGFPIPPGGTALAVLSKPVSRMQFLLAKYAGLLVALAVLTYVNLIAALLASRMAFDAYGSTDLFALGH